MEGLLTCVYLTIGAQRFVRCIEVSAIEGCPLSRVSLYYNFYAIPLSETSNPCDM